MEIISQLDKESIIKFFGDNIIETQAFKKVKRTYIIYSTGIIFLGYLAVHFTILRIILIIIYILLNLFFKDFAKLFLRKEFNKIYSGSEYSYMFDKRTIVVGDEKITIKDSIEERIIEYESIKSIHVLHEYIFIILKNKKYIIIPVCDIELIITKSEFVKLLEEKVGILALYTYPNKLAYK